MGEFGDLGVGFGKVGDLLRFGVFEGRGGRGVGVGKVGVREVGVAGVGEGLGVRVKGLGWGRGRLGSGGCCWFKITLKVL